DDPTLLGLCLEPGPIGSLSIRISGNFMVRIRVSETLCRNISEHSISVHDFTRRSFFKGFEVQHICRDRRTYRRQDGRNIHTAPPTCTSIKPIVMSSTIRPILAMAALKSKNYSVFSDSVQHSTELKNFIIKPFMES